MFAPKMMYCIRIILAIILMLYNISDNNAQINESDTLDIQIKLLLTGIRQSGNVDLTIIRSRAEFLLSISEELKFKSQNNTLYQAFGGFKADDDLNSRNYLYFRPDSYIYPFAMAFMQTNFRRKINYRYFYGVGATWQLIALRNAYLKVSSALVYENTQFTSNLYNDVYYDGSNNIKIWRPTLYMAGSIKFIDDKIKLNFSAYWQPGLDEVANYRFQSEINLDFKFWKGLALSIQYLLQYEQVTPKTIMTYDRLFTFGINYQYSRK